MQTMNQAIRTWTLMKLLVWAFAGSTGSAIIALRT